MSNSECQQTASSPIRSFSSTDYVLPRLRTKFGERAFSHTCPSAWNRLPEDICAEPDITNFRKLLKTHYFNSAFSRSIIVFYHYFNLLVMHPWPSCNGRTRNAVSLWVWVCTKPHHFYCPSPDFTTSIVSQSVTNNRCAPSCGGTTEKWGGTSKKFRPPLCAGIVPPHLQIASDATATHHQYQTCWKERSWIPAYWVMRSNVVM